MSGRVKRVVALATAAAGALTLLTAASAGAGTAGALDLSSRGAIENHLASIGVDPAQVTWQQGRLNYAGPNCPGPKWNCTTSRNVVQLAKEGGVNVAAATCANPCSITQAGEKNQASCTLRSTDEPFSLQSCAITQDGVQNDAKISMLIEQTVGPLQEGRQTAMVDQEATESNASSIQQTITQRTKIGTTQVQNAYQVVEVDQAATGSANTSHIDQSQTQLEEGTAAEQRQNTLPASFEFNCGPEKPFEPNQCVNVQQGSAGGKNDSELHQTISETQKTTALFADQKQGNPTGGQEGNIHQTNPVGVGQNSDSAHQSLVQLQTAPAGASQSQTTDPGCCGLSQVGGEKNAEDIDQKTTQKASEDDADQFSSFVGQVHQTSGGGDGPIGIEQVDTAEGKCSIDQQGKNNSGDGHFTASGEDGECADLELVTICQSGGEIGIEQVEPPACTSSEGGIESLFASPLDRLR
jgi:hypothetical protein